MIPYLWAVYVVRNPRSKGWIAIREDGTTGFRWEHYCRWHWQAAREADRMSRVGRR